MSNGRMSTAPRNTRCTLLLPVPRDCGQVPACSRKSLRDSVAAAPQGLWKITTDIWHQVSPLTMLFQHQQMWLFYWVHWGLWRTHTASTRCSSRRGTASPMWPEEPWTPLCSWGFALSTRAPPGIELWSFRLYTLPVYSLNGI